MLPTVLPTFRAVKISGKNQIKKIDYPLLMPIEKI